MGECGIVLSPFKQEIAGTIFISGIIVVCDKNISKTQQSLVLEILKSSHDLNLKSREINKYFVSHNLYTYSNSRNMILYYNEGQLKRINL